MNTSQNAKQDILETAQQWRWKFDRPLHDLLTEAIYKEADTIVQQTVTNTGKRTIDWDRTLDRLFTSRLTGIPIMISLLMAVLWITIVGANIPSGILSYYLIDQLYPVLKHAAASIGTPQWLAGVSIDGCYLATAWVVSVMLPPMAIFFPMFTLLEDFGYLPRAAFNLDYLFKKCGAHGKQSLSICMGLGCNAAGVISTRIIDSPRERLIAIITNNFAVCNGRWPTLFLIAAIFIGSLFQSSWINSIAASTSVLGIVLLGMGITFALSWVLSKTVLRGEPSIYSLELPPFRPPRILETLYTSLIDRTLFVLWRAIVFALPAGAVIWLVSNITIGNQTLAEVIIGGLDPFAYYLGLNGVILLAYIIAIPANEIVIPTILMLTVLTQHLNDVGHGAGVMFEFDSQQQTYALLHAGGWNLLTAINLMLFCLIHNPCSTTIYTIWKETKSVKWTTVSALLPLLLGFFLCFVTAQLWRIFV